jgi:4'-phosphopantetheinyl transferase
MSLTSESLPVVLDFDSPGPLNVQHCLKLQPGEIHVCRQAIAVGDQELGSLWEVLSAEERTRAERYRFEVSRRTFVVCRGMLRVLLGNYLGESPEQLEFSYSKYGKPELAANGSRVGIEFNVSHTDEFALLAFALNRKIGIDIEKVRMDFNTLEISEHFFSESERTTLRAMAPDKRYEGFFRCWTRKEAFIKALGEGLTHPLNSFDVSIEQGIPPKLLATRPNTEEAARWQLWDVTVPSPYLATLAAETKR